jgi:ParB family transcriptional regulator, chromosome partitioning protein
MAAHASELVDIPPDLIDPNPENPRLVFREADMKLLLASIKEVGILVPLAVYARGRRYVLIDGERRWRTAKRLNLRSVPALVQPEPGPLENLLTMFNIHNVRVEWDLMPMAKTLRRVQELLEADGRLATASNVAGLTGVPLPTVRRALELLELPQEYQDMLLEEAAKPRDQQVIKADLFVEINKASRTIERYIPEVFARVPPRQFLDSMVQKYRSGIVNNVVAYRDISRMARAERAGANRTAAVPAIIRLVQKPDLKIERAYEQTVRSEYEARDIATRASALADRLAGIGSAEDLSDDARAALARLREELDRLTG